MLERGRDFLFLSEKGLEGSRSFEWEHVLDLRCVMTIIHIDLRTLLMFRVVLFCVRRDELRSASSPGEMDT